MEDKQGCGCQERPPGGPGVRSRPPQAWAPSCAQRGHGPGSRSALPSSWLQVLYLLDVVRNGVRTPNMRLTFTLALFIAKAALQLLKPGTTDGMWPGGRGGSECGGRAGGSGTRERGQAGVVQGGGQYTSGGCEGARWTPWARLRETRSEKPRCREQRVGSQRGQGPHPSALGCLAKHPQCEERWLACVAAHPGH